MDCTMHHATEDQDFLIFVHQPKAAGTTLTAILRNQFREGELFEIDGSDPGRSQSEFLHLPAEKKKSIKAISGHMHFGLHEKMNTRCQYITMLRNPISRIVSLYNYIKYSKSHYAHHKITSEKISLREFVQHNIIEEIEENQTKRFSGIQNIQAGEEKNILDIAKYNIQHNFLLAGISEKFDESLLALKILLKWDSIFYTRLNTNSKKEALVIDDATISLIREKNKLDFALYEFTSQLLDEKIASFGQAFHDHLRFFQFTNRMPTQSPSTSGIHPPDIQTRIQAVLTGITTPPISETNRQDLRFLTTYLQQHKTDSPFFKSKSPLRTAPSSVPHATHNAAVSGNEHHDAFHPQSGRRLLNLGCGHKFNTAWTNIDFSSPSPEVMQHDLNAGIPFEDNAFHVVYHSHLLEHFPREHAPRFMRDCFRVLQPGGIIRVAVPDLETIARLYILLLEKSLNGDTEAQQRYEWIMLELFDKMIRNVSGCEMARYWKQDPMPTEDFVISRMGSEVRNVITDLRRLESAAPTNPPRPSAQDIGKFRLSGEIHQWMYDRFSLASLMRNAGFADIRICQADQSAIPGFNAFLLDIEADGSSRKPDSLYMEATKPEPR